MRWTLDEVGSSVACLKEMKEQVEGGRGEERRESERQVKSM
jgi:hypothetical protein